MNLYQMIAYISTMLVILHHSAEANVKRRIRKLPTTNLCDPSVSQKLGYFLIDEKTLKQFFYWFFESRSEPSSDPIVLWLNGLMALPCHC